MEIIKGTVTGDLTAIRKDLGRRVNGGGYYWKCLCSCGKLLSVKDTNMTEKRIISCKPGGRPCKQLDRSIIKPDEVYFNHRVIEKLSLDSGAYKGYYKIECLSCLVVSERRGDTVLSGTFKKCSCQSTEIQNNSL